MNKRAVLRIIAVTALIGGVLPAPAIAQRSVDDAIKLIESFRGGDAKGGAAVAPVSLAPPPRTIADITAILDKQKPDPAKRAANIAAAEKQPPAGATPDELANFYVRRALAAVAIGRGQQDLDDSQKAYELMQQPAVLPFTRMQIVQRLGYALQNAGDLQRAFDAQEQRIQLGLRGGPAFFNRAHRIDGMQQKALLALSMGKLDLARKLFVEVEEFVNFIRYGAERQGAATGNPSGTDKETARVRLLRTRAALARELGRCADAEAALREAVSVTISVLIRYESTSGEPPGTFSDLRDAIYGEAGAALMCQRRLVEAEAEIRRALLNRLERRGRYSSETAGDILLLTHVLYEQGRYDEAEKLAEAARDILENLGHGAGSFALANARRWAANAQSASGRLDAARATYEALERDIAGDTLLRQQFLGVNIDYAATLLVANRVPEAVKIIEGVVEQRQANFGSKAYATAQARGWLGVAQAQGGQKDRALAEFEAAIPILLSSSRESDTDDDGSSVALRDQQTQQIVEAYLGLLADAKGSSAAAETFRLADGIRGKSVQRALAASSARAAASDPALANLVRYEQDGQKQAAALQGLLTNILTRPTSEQDSGAITKLREDIDKLRTARATLREEIERRFPEYANLIDPRPATVEQAQKSLRPGEALIATYVGAERLFVWAVPHQGAPTYASSKVSEVEVEKLVTDLRKALDPSAETLEQVPAFDVATAYRLYELLLKPVEAGWKDAKSLMIVPHKALGQLPTALLVTEKVSQPAKAGIFFAEYKNVPFLARKVAVTQLPSVASLATLRGLPAAPADRETFVAFGDPWFSPEQATQAKTQQVAQLQTRGKLVRRSAPKTDVDSAELALLPRLPDTAEEVRSIALALKADLSKDVFTGAAANEKAVKSMDLTKRKIVMFATHGLVPGDLNGLTQPALALSAPAVAGIDGDGLLTMEEVLALKLNADWVVLSACNTATGSGAGAEAVSGLGRAFFYAGTRALLVSNWPVETTSARILTTDLFRRQAEDAKLARGEAMRQAMVALIDSPGAIDDATKQPMFSYAHPIFWAPFSVVGDGG